MRFYDRLRADGSKLDVFKTGVGKIIMEMLPEATVLVADNVSEYYFAQNDKEVWHISDFPNIAPPFDTCFIEMRRPSEINSTEYGRVDWDAAHRPSQWGILFNATRVNPSDDPQPWVNQELPHFANSPMTRYALTGVRDVAAAGGGWFIGATLVWDAPLNGLEPVWTWGYGVDLHGQPVQASYAQKGSWGHLSAPHGAMAKIVSTVRSQHVLIQTPLMSDPELMTPEGLSSELLNLLKPALLAITFAHCKNVEAVVNNPPAALVKKHVKRGRPPLTRYYTLKINAMGLGRTRKPSMPAGATGIEQSFHIVRGHFKHFTESRKLFGRWVGTYWWAMRTRGNKAIGTVEKDYEVTSTSPLPLVARPSSE